jgi:hypothetical protein
MPTYLARDLAAFTLGLTPRYGFAWPSATEGSFALPCDGWPGRTVKWVQRETAELFTCVAVGLAAFVADYPTGVVVAVAACTTLAARSAARSAMIRRPTYRRRP